VAAGDTPALVFKGVENYLIVPVQNFTTTMAAVPELIGWRLGSTYLQPLSTMLPGHQTTFDQDLKAALQQQYSGGGTAPTMLGEAYANFGPLGWLAIPGLVGAGLGFLYRFARKQRTAAAWALYAYVLMHLANSTIGGILVANVVPVFMVLILMVLAFFEPTRTRFTRHRIGPTAALTP
jgi:oligosaccharide repeat unit polymerase